jgi:hypothetical protein
MPAIIKLEEIIMSKAKTTNIRVLVDQIINGKSIKCGHVACVSSDIATSLQESGLIDTSDAGITYALTEHPDIIDCTVTEQEQEPAPAEPL